MLVNLQRNWFGPDGALYEARLNPLELAESLKDFLPPDAVVVEEPKAEAKPKPEAK